MANGDTGRGKNKVLAGVLALFFGHLGVHHFYLGSTTSGIILLVATVATCFLGLVITGVIGLVEAIMILTMSDEEFDARYNSRDPESMEFVFMKPS